MSPASTVRRLAKRIRKPLERLGAVRDLHVQADHVARLAEQYPELSGFQAWHARQRKKAARKAREYVEDMDLGTLRKGYRRARRDVRYQLAVPRPERHRELALHSVSEAFARVGERRRLLDPADVTTFHAMRVAFKRFRYRAEVVSPLLRRLGRSWAERMHDFQARMGDIQDVHVLLLTLDDFKKKGLQTVREDLGRRLMLACETFLRQADEVFTFWRHDFMAG